MNLLDMKKRLSTFPGSQNQNNYEFLVSLMTKIENRELLPKSKISKHIQTVIKTNKTINNNKNRKQAQTTQHVQNKLHKCKKKLHRNTNNL